MRRAKLLNEADWIIATKERVRQTNAAIQSLRDLTRTELANLLGHTSPGTLTNWENPQNSNVPKGYSAYRYWHHFRVTADWLYRGDESRLPVDLWEKIQEITEGDAAQAKR